MTRDDAIHYLQHKVKEDEPVFILRGRDKIAWCAVKLWANLFACKQGDFWTQRAHAKEAEAVRCAEEMRFYQPSRWPD